MEQEVRQAETGMVGIDAAGTMDIPGSACIGRGYKLHGGGYAEPKYVRAQLFDLTKKEKKQIDATHEYYVPTNVAFIPVRKASYKSISGRTIEQYQTRFCAAVGIKGQYGGFESSLEAEFRSETFRSSSHEYATIMDIIECWQLHLEDPESALLDEARENLANLRSKELFDKYGTHYLKSILVGARANYSCTVDTHRYQSEFKLHSVVEASYLSQVKSEVSAGMERDVKSFQENSTIKVTTWGGNPRFARNIANGMYEQWSESTQEQPVFMGFGDGGLCPIWELCEDPKRKAALRKAAKEYAQEKSGEIEWCKFPLQHNDRIALRADTDRYLVEHDLRGHAAPLILATGKDIDDNATFTVKVVEGNQALDGAKINLLSNNGKYWGVCEFDKKSPANVIEAHYDDPRSLIVRYLDTDKITLHPDGEVGCLRREVRHLGDQGNRQTLVPKGDPKNPNMQSQFSVIVLSPPGDD